MKTIISANTNKIHAFTLAEVLITLAIIGIVAALTIPTVVRNYQKKQTAVKLQKVYSELNQAVNTSIAENGPAVNWDFKNGKYIYETYFKKYLKISKEVGYKSVPSYTYPNGSDLGGYSHSASTLYRVLLQNGVEIGFYLGGDSTRPDQTLVDFYIDINGNDQKPNVVGKDAFLFSLYLSKNGKAQILPRYHDASKYILDGGCKENVGSGSLFYCAAKIMRDGWEIKYDL